jgi:methanogenic corrinoid protein MtbC1
MDEIIRSTVDHPIMSSPFVAPEILKRDDAADRQAKLAKVVAKEVIPRLMSLHQQVLTDQPHPSATEIAHLAQLVLGPDNHVAAEFVRTLRARGLLMEALFVELLEPAAQQLGVMWENDECDFIDVTLGVGRLQELLAIFNSTHDMPALIERRRVLLATPPNEQHRFGIAIIEKFFRAGGWNVEVALGATPGELAALVDNDWYAVAGLTLSNQLQLGELQAAIRSIRANSRNPGIGIMVGGSAFAKYPDLLATVGADATAINAPTAVLVAQKLFDLGAKKGGCQLAST